ncbi:MAG: DinB family protein [Ignavibacteria bacterium]|nr:DinB family protein [Ignavibacteria bacterium]
MKSLDKEKLTSIIKYRNTKGDEYQNRLSDIITHVINHSSYHRGQIALLVRNAGGIPAVTDYIAYRR